MRVYKKNTIDAIPFHEAVEDIALNKPFKKKKAEKKSPPEVSGSEKTTANMVFFFQTLLAFQSDCSQVADKQELLELLKKTIKKVIPVKNVAFLLVDEENQAFKPAESKYSYELLDAINTYKKDTRLAKLFEATGYVMFPFLGAKADSEQKLNILAFPLYHGGVKKAFLVILTPGNEKSITEAERDTISLLGHTALSAYETISTQENTTTLYADLQDLSAKISNEFRLAAVGEMAEQIVEDIRMPLQVMLAHIEYLHPDGDSVPEVQRVKAQIARINELVARLIKFSENNKDVARIEPCDLNAIISEYYKMVKTSLDHSKIELVLDFDRNLPPLLSHSNYIQQILSNLFVFIKKNRREKTGLLLRTRQKEGSIHFTVVSTSTIVSPETTKSGRYIDLTVRIIDNFMKKHSGSFSVEPLQNSGSQIKLIFPIQKK